MLSFPREAAVVTLVTRLSALTSGNSPGFFKTSIATLIPRYFGIHADPKQAGVNFPLLFFSRDQQETTPGEKKHTLKRYNYSSKCAANARETKFKALHRFKKNIQSGCCISFSSTVSLKSIFKKSVLCPLRSPLPRAPPLSSPSELKPYPVRISK